MSWNDNQLNSVFCLFQDYVTVYLSVESRHDLEQWVHALEEAIKLANQKQELSNGN